MNVMILGGASAPPSPGEKSDGAGSACAARTELEARLARIEACLEALERALLPGRAAKRTRPVKDGQAPGPATRTTKRKETSHAAG